MALSLFGALLGCAAPPPYEKPTVDLPDKYSVLAPLAAETSAFSVWWRDLGDPMLNALVERALADNLTLAEARARMRQASAQASFLAGLPEGDLTLDANSSSDDANTIRLSVNADFSPFGAGRPEKSAAAARREAAYYGEFEARRIVVEELTIAYIELRFLNRLLAFRREELASLKRLEKDIAKNFERSAATRLDVSQAGALRAETQVEIARIEGDTSIQRHRIATLAGSSLQLLGIDLSKPGRQPMPKSRYLAGVPADLLRTRPDIREAERLYAAAVSDLGEAQANRYPRISLEGAIQTLIDGGGTNKALAAGLRIPLLSQNRLRAEVQRSEAAADEAYATWRRLVIEAIEDVEVAHAVQRAAERSSLAAREAVLQNEDALAFHIEALERGGNVTLQDVINQHRSLARARLSLAASTKDIGTHYVRLRSALGMSHLPVEVVPQ